MVVEGIIDEATYDEFLSSIVTVATDFADDSKRLSGGELSKADFLIKYGHLRPGTYDITTPRYDATNDYFKVFRDKSSEVATSTKTNFSLTPMQHAKITEALRQHGFLIRSRLMDL